MTEENSEKLFELEELYEMFNCSFLPKLQEIARRAKSQKLPEKEVKFFNVRMHLQFTELDEPLTYQMIEDRIQLTLQPVTQEDIDKSVEENKEKADEK